MIFLVIFFGAGFVSSAIAAVRFAKRSLQLDDFIQNLNEIVSDYASFLRAKTARGALVDTPEVRDFHNRTLDFLSAMEQWSDSIVRGEPIKRQSNAELMGSDPNEN